MGSIVGLGVASSIIIDLLRSVFFIIDGLIYGVAGLFFKFALEFVNINDFINLSNVLTRVSQVVYSFLAIFMFFRVSFSLLQWLVDPDKMADKELGAKKIVINVMICLFLIVAVPKVFEVAMNVQDKVIKENLIGQAIYGDENVKVNDVGETLARATWGLFIRPADNLIDANIFINETEVWDNYFNVSQGVNDDAVALLKLFGVLNSKTVIVAGEYKLVYLFFISTIVGLYLCWTFVKLAIDFAYRAIKMFMLQLLSPIAIISYIDPKSSKNGVFAKWLKETVKTYISLFVRIACYSIAALLMNEFVKSLYERETSIINKILIINGDTFISLIYILAIIAFIKNAPKFIDGILGTEISKGSETKFASDLLRGGLGAIGGAAAGAIGGAVVAGRKNLPMGRSVWEGAKKGLTSGFSSAKKGSFIDYGKNIISGASGQGAREYFGLPKYADERKALRTKERAEVASDTYDALKSSFGYKDAPDAMTKATKLADAFRTKGIRFDPITNEKDKELNKALMDADEADLKDNTLMMERGKVLDTALAYRKLVDDGTISQEMADKLTMQAIRKYNKLAAHHHYKRAEGDLNGASGRAIQLEVSYDGKSATELQSIVTSKQLSNYQEILGMSVSGIPGIENMSVADIERTLRITISDDKREKINNIRNKSNTLRTTVDKKEISEFVADIDKFTEKAVAADGVSGKAEALLGKANAAVDEEMKISSKSSEFIKRVQLGDKYRSR